MNRLFNIFNAKQMLWPGLFGLLLVAAAGCRKENRIEYIDDEPVVVPDTTVQNYYGNLMIGNGLLPADTIFTEVQFGSPANPDENLGYDLQAFIGPWPSFLLHWAPNSVDEPGITEGNYIGCCALTMSDTAREQMLQWVIHGRDPMNVPQLDLNTAFVQYQGQYVTVNISEVIHGVQTQIVGNDTLYIDRAKVKLNGVLLDNQNHAEAVSGEFICYFGRTY